MDSQSDEIVIRRQFDSYFKKVLKNEMRRFFNEREKQREHKVSLNSLSESELAQLSVLPDYFADGIHV